jgi:hypothetical protein
MTTYTWAVTALYTETIGTEQDYVVIANYEVVGVDGVANLEACIQGQIDSLITPPVSPVSTPLPF